MIAQVLSTPRLSYWIGAPYQGNDYGTEAVRALVKACLRSLDRDVTRASPEPRR